MKRLRLSLAALLLPCFASAASLLDASIDRDTITVGDPIRLTIRSSATPGEAPLLPEFPEGKIGPFSILDRSPVREETRDGVRTAVLDLRVTAFETGALEIPALEAGEGAAATAPISVTVRSVGLDASGRPRDVKRPISLGRDWLRTLLLPALALLLAAAGLYAYLRLRRRAKAPVPVLRPVDLRPAHVIAGEALDALEREYAGDDGVPRAFCFRLSLVLREYLDRRYAIPAPERTTREILRELRRENLRHDEAALLRDVLSRCDIVKFRGIEPGRAEANEVLRGARGFVEKTREAEPPAPEEGS
jgi:hypothetical protein